MFLVLLALVSIVSSQNYNGSDLIVPSFSAQVNSTYSVYISSSIKNPITTISLIYNFTSRNNNDSFQVDFVNAKGETFSICGISTSPCQGRVALTIQNGFYAGNYLVFTNKNSASPSSLNIKYTFTGNYGFTYPQPNDILFSSVSTIIKWNFPISQQGILLITGFMAPLQYNVDIGSGQYTLPPLNSNYFYISICTALNSGSTDCATGNAYITSQITTDLTKACYGDFPSSGCTSYGNGICLKVDTCTCMNGYNGTKCEIPPNYTCFGSSPNTPYVCGSGQCTGQDTCTCTPDYTGNRCQNPTKLPIYTCYGILSNSTNVCGGKGVCTVFGLCSCNNGNFTGPTCGPIKTTVSNSFPLRISLLGFAVAFFSCIFQ